MLLVGWQEGHPACRKTEWWVAGMVICLERGADLHMALLMPLPLTVSCFSGPVVQCVCVCCTVYNCALNSSLMVVSVVEIYASLVFLYQLVIVGCWSYFDFVHTFVPYTL